MIYKKYVSSRGPERAVAIQNSRLLRRSTPRNDKTSIKFLAALFFVFFPIQVFSHGDDDHGQGTSVISSSPIIFVKKESQFAISLKTEKVTMGPVQTMVEALGQIIPKPSLRQDLTAIKEGRLTQYQNTSIPVV